MTVLPSEDRFLGALLGLSLGDALGAPFEGGPLERAAWRLIGRRRTGEMRWTDDTQMSLDLAESLLERGELDLDDVAVRFARSYRWSRGYGPGAAKVLKRIRRGAPWQAASRAVYPEGSLGNGGAMRAPVLALRYATEPKMMLEATRSSAMITHAHPLGLEGAALIATATFEALQDEDGDVIFERAAAQCAQAAFQARLERARAWRTQGASPAPKEVARALGRGIVATESCVTALYLGLRFLERPFLELMRFVADCGGDVDTICAMSGAIWGAKNGATKLPEDALSKLEERPRLEAIARALHEAARR